MPEQRLSTTLQLDAVLGGGYKDAFSSASDLISDLKKESGNLRKELKKIGREADEVEKVGMSADGLRRDFRLLERQIKETERATEKFGQSRRHFRKASIGARALRSDVRAIAGTARNAALAIAGIGTAAAIAFSPDEEVLDFDRAIAGIGVIAPEADLTALEGLKSDIRELSNVHGIAASEIAMQHKELTEILGFDTAQQTLTTAVEFQTATGMGITDLAEELRTAKISLGIDTSEEMKTFLDLLAQSKAAGIKIDNLDLGDLETLQKRTGEGILGENFQREFLTTISFRQLDSIQFADYAANFQKEFDQAISVPSPTITPGMDISEIKKAQKEHKAALDNLKLLEKYGLKAEDGILGAMRAFQALNKDQQVSFQKQLEPILGDETVEVIARGSESLPRITQQVQMILDSDLSLEESAEMMTDTWSGAWRSIGFSTRNSLSIIQEQFAKAFGGSIRDTVFRLFSFIDKNQDSIKNFFTGIRDGITPVVSRLWNVIRNAYPVIKSFATDVWRELKVQFEAVYPLIKAVGRVVMSIARAIGGFAREHPRLVATLITGAIAWKAYKIAAGGFGIILNTVKGTAALAQGHIHRLNAMILQNARVSGTLQTASLSISKAFSGIGRAALGAVPSIGAMGGTITAAIIPALPVILPVVAAVAALGAAAYIVYRNWEPISAFFKTHFETIRNVLLLVFPPLGLLVSFADIIRQNWQGIKEFFATIWETIKLTAMVAFEGIKFVGLNALLAIRKIWAGVPSFFAKIWEGVVGVFVDTPLAPIFQWMTENVMAVVRPLFGFFDKFWQHVADAAGRVLNWITDKFKAINSLLQKVLGWMRDRNEEIQDGLDVVGQVGMDVSLPELQTGQTGELNQIVTLAPMPDIGVDIPTVDMADIETPSTDPVEMPAQITMPAMTPVMDAPDTLTQRNDELVKIGMGQLVEARKQTMLLESLKSGTHTEVRDDIPDLTKSVVVGVDLPVVDLPAVDVPGVDMPIVDLPAVDVPAATAPVVDMPAVDVPGVDMPVVDMPAVDVPGVDMPIVDLPAVDVPAATTPVVDMPAVDVPGVDMPAVAPPIVDMVGGDMPVVDLPKVDVPAAPPPVVDMPAVDVPAAPPPVVDMPAVDVPAAPPPVVDMPAVDMPAVDVPAAATPIVDMPVMDMPKVDVAQPQLPAFATPIIDMSQLQVDVAQPRLPAIDDPQSEMTTVPAINKMIVGDLIAPMPDVGFGDIPALQAEDLPEMEIQDAAMPTAPPLTQLPAFDMQDAAMPTAPPPIQLQEYEVPVMVKEIEREVVSETGGETQADGQTQPPNVTLNFNITQSPGQDPEELSKIIMRTINESTDSFLIQ